MTLRRSSSLVLLLVACISTGAGQSASTQTADSPVPTRDSRALTILTQASVVTGGTAGIGAIRDLTAAGTITYFWAGKEVVGPVRLRHRGHDQFRLDANLPTGVRSYSLNHSGGLFKDESGKITEIPFFNAMNSDVFAFLFRGIEAALRDDGNSVSYVDSVAISSSQQAHHIRVKGHLPAENSPYAFLSNLMVTDYFVGAQSNLVWKVSGKTYSMGAPQKEFPQSFEFEDYQNMDGVNFPMLIREKIGEQEIWEIRLDSVSFNTGITDLDFDIQ